MKIIRVLIERKAQALNREFTYLYQGEKAVAPGFRVLVPFHNSKLIAFVTGVEMTSKSREELEKELGYKLSDIHDVLDDKPLLDDDLMRLADEVSEHYLAPKIAVLQAMLPTSLKPRMSSLKGPGISYEKYLVPVDVNEEGLTPKQIETLRLIKRSGEVLKRELKSQSVVKKLLGLGLIKEKLVEKRRLSLEPLAEEPKKTLTKDQKDAVEAVLSSERTVFLLEGVTGSGKTEVYLALSERYLAMGKNVLMLVPEISLTSMMVRYFEERFREDVAILHSDLTPGEKYDEYRRIAEGKCRVVVGARSAVFAPLTNIGLIVLDEEHVETYKQDSVPCYHAREVAIMRARHFGAKVLLGSATPSLESKARAVKGVYGYFQLTKRINEYRLPETTIIDMSRSANLSVRSYMFAKLTLQAMEETLNRGEQIILLINRRGFASSVACRKCGHIFKCPDCGLTLTYHREDNMLKCHHCGHVELMPETCPECGSGYLMRLGFGTERIVREVNKLFPAARVLRLDSDVGEVRKSVIKTIDEFRRKEADVLVGTQMIAKGHDFPDVTLVVAVLADIGLSLPSFRSGERTFQLITQAVGRSGRGEKQGRAIIQTYNPRHYAITTAASQDYEAFYRREMAVRKAEQYPPFTFLIALTVSGQSEEKVIGIIHRIAEKLISLRYETVTVLGPIAPYYREKGVSRRLILIKYKDGAKIYAWLGRLLAASHAAGGVMISADVDPYAF